VLRVHHVRDDVAEPWPWDLAFLAASGVLIVAGWVIVRRSRM